MGINLFKNIYYGKRVLITGHTGFKGSWLALWLQEMGAEVTGVSLSPEPKQTHWDLLKLNIGDNRIDIRDLNALKQIYNEIKPSIIFHLAAQPLVRRSYRDPIETWSTNIMGTVNMLEACRETPSVRAIVAITSDKCYENQEWPWGYRENDRLGGHDPYSASKAVSELVASSYRSSFFSTDCAPLLATARAGNVIGGGDWSEDRLIPDLIRALESGNSLEVRSPQATRPWQHVLESLSGYLLLGQKLLLGEKFFADAWNFGPGPDSNRKVYEVLNKINNKWGSLCWHTSDNSQPHEANLLYIDSTKARSKLGWKSNWDFDTTLEKTTDWYRAWLEDANLISRKQLAEYVEDATNSKFEWALN